MTDKRQNAIFFRKVHVITKVEFLLHVLINLIQTNFQCLLKMDKRLLKLLKNECKILLGQLEYPEFLFI